jgi:glutamate-1-semialdehyde 2,1-aminomutase
MAVSEIDKKLFREAKKYIPGGVNSPVRSFSAVGGWPVFIKKAKGSKIYGEQGRGFIDYCLSWGALILGHGRHEVTEALREAVGKGTSFGAAAKHETELAMLITEAVPSIGRIRLTNSGTEAVMGAVRLARAYTGKNKIIKFTGAYHGHADYLLTESLGIPKDFTKHTIVVPYNDIKKTWEAVKKHQKDLAAIIVEPVAANHGVILPKRGFLEGLRETADKYDIVLIFDEVITGFRLSFGGAQEYFNVQPDLTCLGKIVGGGMPVGAFGGKKEIMSLLAPEGGVYQAGTLSGNPVAVAAGIVTLNILKRDNPYGLLANKTKELCEGIKMKAEFHKVKLEVNYIGSIFSVFFQEPELFKRFFHGLLDEGIYFSPSGFEADFLSAAHTEKDLEKTLNAVEKTIGGI